MVGMETNTMRTYKIVPTHHVVGGKRLFEVYVKGWFFWPDTSTFMVWAKDMAAARRLAVIEEFTE